MFRITALLIFTFSLLNFNLSAQEKKSKIDFVKEGYVKATVIHYEIESCGFIIELTDKEKTKLMPDKLDEAFKKNKEKIWVKYSIAKKQPMGTCMAGKFCEIIDIRKRK